MSAERLRLGVVDTQQPWWMPELVPLLDRLGYHRYWATEHHGSGQSASPVLMTALAAGLSERLRVGTAGVLLAYASPLKLAQDFRLLELMYPGRLDLGVVQGDVAGALGEALRDGRPPPAPEDFARRLRQLGRLVAGETGEAGDVPAHQLGPPCPGRARLWLCGGSERSAALAARLGLAYSFHDYLATCDPRRDGAAAAARGQAIVAAYRAGFVPGAHRAAAACNVAAYGICAASATRARQLWAAVHARQEHLPRPSFCGDPATCRAQLHALAQRYQVRELVIQSLAVEREACFESYRLLAAACALGAARARAGLDQVSAPARMR